jgi:hypothetical protein
MTLAAMTVRMIGVLGACSLVLAAVTLWVVFNEPVTVARIAYTGDLSPLFDLVTAALTNFVRAAVRYL